MRSLTRRGVIQGCHAAIDPAALNHGVQAMVSVQVRPLSRAVIDAFKASAAKMPEVLSVSCWPVEMTSCYTAGCRIWMRCTGLA